MLRDSPEKSKSVKKHKKDKKKDKKDKNKDKHDTFGKYGLITIKDLESKREEFIAWLRDVII